MARDHRKLRAFLESDELVVTAYTLTGTFPSEERYGLQSQIRRAAVSVSVNVVEGSARTSVVEYCRFLDVASASARECSYLFRLCSRLSLMNPQDAAAVANAYDRISASLIAAIKTLRALDR